MAFLALRRCDAALGAFWRFAHSGFFTIFLNSVRWDGRTAIFLKTPWILLLWDKMGMCEQKPSYAQPCVLGSEGWFFVFRKIQKIDDRVGYEGWILSFLRPSLSLYQFGAEGGARKNPFLIILSHFSLKWNRFRLMSLVMSVCPHCVMKLMTVQTWGGLL